MKSVMIQFGVRNFNPTLRRAPEKLDAVRTPEGIPLPPNTIALLRRHMERKRVIEEQIKAIEQARQQRMERDPADKLNAMVMMLTRIVGLVRWRSSLWRMIEGVPPIVNPGGFT